jgi:soluble lytic murein transglycosylase
MVALQMIRIVALTAILSCFLMVASRAEIYRYIDEDGVWHFTNIKTDRRYRLYISDSRKSASEYIEEYEPIISKASKKYGVSSSLIKAVIKAESDFDHTAVSHKGAQGLMQLMPDTADAMEVENPFDPEENILGGTRYLSQLLKRYKKDTKLALAAYNAGPENVEPKMEIPPFPETKKFVRRVLRYYKAYKNKSK